MTDPLPATSTEVLYRGDTRVWQDTIEENTGTADAPVWTAKDVSGYTFRCQIRATQDDTDVMATIAVDFVTDGTDGKITRTLTATEARKLIPGTVWFDLELTSATDAEDVHTYLAGKWKVKADVSRL